MQVQSREVREGIATARLQAFVVRHQLLLFYVIALCWAWALWIPMALNTLHIIDFPLSPIVGQSIGAFSPLGTLLILDKLSKGRISSNKILSPPDVPKTPRVLLIGSMVIFPALGVAASFLHFAVDPSQGLDILVSGPLKALGWGLLAVVPVQYFAALLSSPLFEEPGWRGFALVRLQARTHPALASLVVGVLWWAWHVPINIANELAIEPLSFVGMLGTSFLIDTVFRRSGNRTLVAMFCHGGTITGFTFFAGFYIAEMIACTWIVVIVLGIILKKR